MLAVPERGDQTPHRTIYTQYQEIHRSTQPAPEQRRFSFLELACVLLSAWHTPVDRNFLAAGYGTPSRRQGTESGPTGRQQPNRASESHIGVIQGGSSYAVSFWHT